MRNLTLLVSSLLFIACGDDDRSRTSDAGIVRIDGGGVMDSGAAGPLCSDPVVSLAEFNATDPELMGTLLPRCATTTAQCFQTCADGDGDCIDACIAADPTPPLAGEPDINCDFCLSYQIDFCFDQNCPTQYAAYRCCRQTNGCTTAECPACATQETALDTCLMGDFSCADDLGACF